MARTTVSITTMLGAYGDYSTANAADLTWQAADVANGNQVLGKAGDIILFKNTDAVNTYYVTITSVALFGRTGDITQYDVGPAETAHFGPYQHAGWKQTDGYLYLDAEHADIEFCVLRAA